MKTEKNILLAFLLNFAFSIFEFVGGIVTGSIAIASDALHDVGDAASIGVSYFLEKKSKKQPDEQHTYGYGRYSVLGGAITTLILLIGSVLVIYNAALRIISPTQISYNGMIIFAVVGVIVNLAAALLTREHDSLNQKAVNLHMLEDVLGWVVVLLGAVVMKFTDFALLDPIMSIGVAIFILINALKTLQEVVNLFLEKTPDGLYPNEVAEQICQIEGVKNAHHIHLWSMDGHHHYATAHVVLHANADAPTAKEKIRAELKTLGICHITLELEGENEPCHQQTCRVELCDASGHHHHHHHHHHHNHGTGGKYPACKTHAHDKTHCHHEHTHESHEHEALHEHEQHHEHQHS